MQFAGALLSIFYVVYPWLQLMSPLGNIFPVVPPVWVKVSADIEAYEAMYRLLPFAPFVTSCNLLLPLIEKIITS